MMCNMNGQGLHTGFYMEGARRLYERMGFELHPDAHYVAHVSRNQVYAYTKML